jgi:hypothetical protein
MYELLHWMQQANDYGTNSQKALGFSLKNIKA